MICYLKLVSIYLFLNFSIYFVILIIEDYILNHLIIFLTFAIIELFQINY